VKTNKSIKDTNDQNSRLGIGRLNAAKSQKAKFAKVMQIKNNGIASFPKKKEAQPTVTNANAITKRVALNLLNITKAD
jgi:hypothetical protein